MTLHFLLNSAEIKLCEILGIPVKTGQRAHQRIVLPTHEAPILVETGDRRRLLYARWGLVPSWAGEGFNGSDFALARAESDLERAVFRGAFRSRRCLVPADGFVVRPAEGDGRHWLFLPPDGAPLAFAGVWEAQVDGGHPTFAMLTTQPNLAASGVADRLPAIVPAASYGTWLDPKSDVCDLQAILSPAHEGAVVAWPVGGRSASRAMKGSSSTMRA